MAIAKKSLIAKASPKTSKGKTTAPVSGSATPGKMVPAMRLGKAQLTTAKAGMQTGMTRF
jgi:hypothetical protein